MLELLSRFQHLLWKILPKRTQVIDGHTIVYVVVPQCLLFDTGSKKIFADAMCLVHFRTESLMILISSLTAVQDDFRYTLLHEHLEGMMRLGFPVSNYDKKWAQTTYTRALSEITQDVPDITERIDAAVDLKEGDDVPHFFALIIELALIKKERPDQYPQALEYALLNRF